MQIKFSRDNIQEFIDAVSPEAVKVNMSFSAQGDEAVVFPPFTNHALVLKGGDSVVISGEIKGSMPVRHRLTVQNNFLDSK